jgi:Low-density lipoprotein receptor domain class A
MKSLILLFLLVTLATYIVSGSRICHNATGSCTKTGFVCANGKVIDHNKRCNFVEDCVDGSDEYLCEFKGDRSIFNADLFSLRLAIIEITCIKCLHYVDTITIPFSNKLWIDNIKKFPCDYNKKQFEDVNGMGVNVYKKNKKKNNNKVCCLRQVS